MELGLVMNCPHCGMGHSGTCPRIRAIEYHTDGTVKRIEFHAPQQPIMTPMPAPRLKELPELRKVRDRAVLGIL